MTPRELQRSRLAEAAWNGPPEWVTAPYAKGVILPVCTRVPPHTWNVVGNRRDHPARLNTHWRPIANKYREGTVKRTPGGE